jgi:TonB-linked SusC/RagA family outer membrane protein
MLNGDEYITMQLEELQNARGIFEVPDEIAYNTDFVDFYNYSANTDWLDEVTQPGLSHDHYFKTSGGGEKTAFFVSLNAANEQGTTINEGFDRLSTRINLDYNLSDNLKFTVFFDYTNSHKDGNYRFRFDVDNDGRSDWVNLRRMAYMKAPNMSIWEYDENGNQTGEYFTPINSYQGRGDIYFNPVAIGNLSENDVDRNIFQNSYLINFRINKWLRLVETISFQYDNRKQFSFLPYTAIGTDWLDGEINRMVELRRNNQRISSRSQLIFTPIVSSTHRLTATLLGQISQRKGEFSRMVGRNGPTLQITDPSSAPHVQGLNSSSFDIRSLGAMLSVNYKYRDKYITSAIVRGDASSSFGRDNRWGIFPSFSLGWRFSNEPWFAGFDALNNGMLRIGYGQAGKEPGDPYDRFGVFVNANPNQYILNDVIIPSQIDLANLKWQTVESWNLGIELSFINRRINISGDVYNKITKDILWKRYSIPSSSGFNRLLWFNGGQLQNRGWEGAINVVAIRKDDLNLTVNFNVSRNMNSFLEFPDNFNNIVGTEIGNGVYPRMAQIGQPVGSFYGFNYLGVYATEADAVARDANENVRVDANGEPIPMRYASGYEFTAGDAIYEDTNHDGMIDINDVVYLGDSNPEYTGGFGFNGRWKQVTISTHFLYRTGFDIVNEIASQTEGMLDRNNQSKAVLHRWRKEGDNAEGVLPRAYLDHPANNLGSSRYVEDGTFLRLNNVSISYQFNPELASKLKVDNLELGLNLRKIWTLTDYSGQDPEISQNIDDPFWFGTDNGITPPPNVYSAFLNIMF